MDAPVFHCFSNLPQELRNMIWSASMPSDGPVIYPFGQYFVAHTVKQEGITIPPEITTQPLVQLPTPPSLFVCREARQAAEWWMASVNAWLHLRNETQGHVVVRKWSQETDLLYVPPDKWRFFISAMLVTEGSDDYQEMQASVRNLVLPAFTAWDSLPEITALMEAAMNLASVYLLWGALPLVRKSSHNKRLEAAVQSQWTMEVEDSEEVSMCFTDEKGTVSWERGELEEWMYEFSQELAIQEVPPRFVNDKGEVTLPFVPVRLKKE